ncbi:hypothetical protein [Dactylosporangium sp. CA-233914]|uniref:hypothetical protein n=1 Tax=Dactylosporangium sp. CA-233914 TaxID=3239934 RepID=UPI003D8CDEEF
MPKDESPSHDLLQTAPPDPGPMLAYPVPPVLNLIWPTRPDLALSGGTGESGRADPPERAAYRIGPGSILASEQDLLNQIGGVVQRYEEFRLSMAARQKWIWVVTDPSVDASIPTPETAEEAHARENGNSMTPGSSNFQGKGAQPEGNRYWGLSQEQVDDINRGMDSLLLLVADRIHLVGNFIAALNEAAQAYANADHNATMPLPFSESM